MEGTLKSINNIFDLKLKFNSIKTFSLLLTELPPHTCGTHIFCVCVCVFVFACESPRLMSLIICIIYKNSHVMIKIYAHSLGPEDTLPTLASASTLASAPTMAASGGASGTALRVPH